MTPAGLVRLGLPPATTAELLADRAALAAAVEAAHAAAATAPQPMRCPRSRWTCSAR